MERLNSQKKKKMKNEKGETRLGAQANYVPNDVDSTSCFSSESKLFLLSKNISYLAPKKDV